MNFSMGKCITSLWFGLVCFGMAKHTKALDALAGMYFLVLGIIYLVMATMYNGQEKDHIESLLKQVEDVIKEAEEAQADGN